MGTTRLGLYNDALLQCKERFLASLTENVKARRLLDSVWNGNGVNYCLEQGQWQFAMRSIRIEYDPDITPEFGYTYAFNKPDDWILTSAVCSDDRFVSPVRRYADEVDYWLSDDSPLYIKYVSNDEAFGGDLSRWPSTFCDYVGAYFASKIVLELTGSKELYAAIMQPKSGQLERSLLIAKNRAMMTQPATRPVAGSWVRSRASGGRLGPMGDGGNSGSLIG